MHCSYTAQSIRNSRFRSDGSELKATAERPMCRFQWLGASGEGIRKERGGQRWVRGENKGMRMGV